MTKIKDLIGKEAMLDDQKVLVLKKVDGTRTKVLVQYIDRGKGWDEKSQSYKGIKTHDGWQRGQNYRYGNKVEVSFIELKI